MRHFSRRRRYFTFHEICDIFFCFFFFSCSFERELPILSLLPAIDAPARSDAGCQLSLLCPIRCRFIVMIRAVAASFTVLRDALDAEAERRR